MNEKEDDHVSQKEKDLRRVIKDWGQGREVLIRDVVFCLCVSVLELYGELRRIKKKEIHGPSHSPAVDAKHDRIHKETFTRTGFIPSKGMLNPESPPKGGSGVGKVTIERLEKKID